MDDGPTPRRFERLRRTLPHRRHDTAPLPAPPAARVRAEAEPLSAEGSRPGLPGAPAPISGALAAADEKAVLVGAVRRLRRMLPGDAEYGDPLSTAGRDPASMLARRIVEAEAHRPSALREAGLAAVQVWQAISEVQGRGRGDREIALLFTDLVDHSAWALQAGDTKTIAMLRDVGRAVEPAMTAFGGRIVKRLGDGLMATFPDAQSALAAAGQATAAVEALEVDGYRPKLRTGVHVGRPRRIGGDYLGIDVNVAARVMEAARPGEILVSDAARRQLDPRESRVGHRRRLRAKGVPDDLLVYSASAV